MKNSHTIAPPAWPLRILRFFLKKDFLEEIEGDMEELYQDNLVTHSPQQAKWLYTMEMFKLLRPILIKNMEGTHRLNRYGMFKNYFKISFRGLMKHPMNAFINVFGLAAAIGACIFAYAFADWTYSTDQFHENKNEVFLVTFYADRDGTTQQYGRTPRPMGEMLSHDFAAIKKVCRIEDRNVILKHKDNVYHEQVRFTDPAFLEMLSFPLKWGTISSLNDVNSIILSENMSIKYFGNENPIGQTVLMKFDETNGKAFKVTGVAKEFPKSKTISFHFLVNIENLKTAEPGFDFDDWQKLFNATLIQVDDARSISTIEHGMEKYKALQNEAVQEEWAIDTFGFEPLATLHKRADNIRENFSRGSEENYSSIFYMTIISTFLLALACLNYINIAIVTAAKRLKEIGVRKSIGATRSNVIVQFLAENLLITFFALALGLVLGMTIFIPGFEVLFDFSMDFSLSNPKLWIFLPAILLFTSLASGIYPSLYISKFQVVGILKGSVKFGKKNPITKIFLGVQLILACIFITSAIMFTRNSSYMAKRSWGYDQANTLYAVIPTHTGYEELSAAMAQDPDVIGMSGSMHHLGRDHKPTILRFPDREFEVNRLAIGPGYFETMGLQVKAGRDFYDQEGSDKQQVIVNAYMAENLGWVDPIGQQFRIDSIQYEVIGVVENFHSYSFSRPMKPTIFTTTTSDNYHYLSLKVHEGSALEVYRSLQKSWLKLFPEIPFNGGMQEDVWGFYFEEIRIHGLVWRVIAFIAVTLASLGLYGLITLNVAGRTKEFSIRKILGAGLKSIAANVTRQYVALFIISLGIGMPVSYLLLCLLFNSSYEYHIPVDFYGAIAAGIILVSVLILTASTQITKVLNSNAVNGLKVE